MSAAGKGRIEASLCEKCYEVFFSKKLFEVHVQKCQEVRTDASASVGKMASSTLSKCASCRRIFLGGQNLATHVKKEHGIKKIVKTVLSCVECNQLFMDAETLSKHKKEKHPHAVSSSSPATNDKIRPIVVTFSQPSLDRKPGEVSKPKETESSTGPQSKSRSDAKTDSKPATVSKPNAQPKLPSPGKLEKETSTPVKKDLDIDASEPENSDPASESVPNTQSVRPEPADPSADTASMPMLDVVAESSQLLDKLMDNQEPEVEEVQPDVMDVASTDTPLLLQALVKPNSNSRTSKVDTPQAKTPDKRADASRGHSSGKVGIRNATPVSGRAVSSIPSTSAASKGAAASVTSTGVTPGLFFSCGACSSMFSDKDMMLKHLSEKHGRKPPPEPRKSTVPPTKKLVSQGTLYACAMCNARFPTVEQVKSHIETVHRARARRRDTVWSTQECKDCSSLFQPSLRMRDIYMKLSDWIQHFYGEHGKAERLSSGKRLELLPCQTCGLVFFNKATRQHHNVISHDGVDPELQLQMRTMQMLKSREAAKLATTQITPKSLTAKARSRVIVDSLMKASLVSRSAPTVTMDKTAAQRAQNKVFASRASSGSRVTNVVFKCSLCGGMFPDDPSFERHAREAHRSDGGPDGGPGSPASDVEPDPPPAVDSELWDVLQQRECSDCSKLMESCPRSFALFVYRDVWEKHVDEVHVTGRWRCTGEKLHLHPCPHCPRLFMHPNTLEAHQTKLHDTMICPVDQANVDACTPMNTLECSRCSQLVQQADGIRFMDGTAWKKHFDTEHKKLLLCDGKAGDWELFPCSKCPRLFFSESDIPKHEARQATMHMALPTNAKVVNKRTAPETEIRYQCANEYCSFTCKEHDEMVAHFEQCQAGSLSKVGETLMFRTVMVRKPQRPRGTKNMPREARRLENVILKLAPGGGTGGAGAGTAADVDGQSSEEVTAVAELQRAHPIAAKIPTVLELDPVTSQPRTAYSLEAAEDVPEAAEEETVAAEEAQPESSDAGPRPTFMNFVCSVCQMRGSSREEMAAHIRRDHIREDGTYGLPCEADEERRRQLTQYKTTYLCSQCKGLAESCPRTSELFFEKAAWLNHLATTHKPTTFNELDRLALHECEACERLLLSNASLKRHTRAYHALDAGNVPVPVRTSSRRSEKHKFDCVEEGCTFKYHRISKLRTHLIEEHKFDLAVREVVFNNENDFQEWKKRLELTTSASFVLRSNVQAKRKRGTFDVRYYACSRVMTNLPTYKENGKKRCLPWQVDLLKEDMVWRCPAFMKAEVASTSTAINVSFCPNHYGHDMDPSFGRLSDADEAEIGGMLRAGLSIQDVLKKMREEGRREGTPSRKQRVTEAEINRIFEKYMGMKPPKAKRFDPLVGKAVSRSSVSRVVTESPARGWNADMVTSYDGGPMDAEDGAIDELSFDDAEAVNDGVGYQDVWQRVCGEDGCRFTTSSVGSLRAHLRQRHGFAMHIDTAGFASMKDFTRWKRSLEKRTCAKYTCYKSVSPDDPSDPVVTKYFTCHRSGLNSLKRAHGSTPLPRRLVLCTGYMKVRCDTHTGEVACEYCASHYGHDARLADRRVTGHESIDMEHIEHEEVEDDGETMSPGVGHFMSPTATRYSFVREDVANSDQELEQPQPKRPRGRPPKKRQPATPRRSRGGKRRRWEEVEEMEEEEELQHDDSFESD